LLKDKHLHVGGCCSTCLKVNEQSISVCREARALLAPPLSSLPCFKRDMLVSGTRTRAARRRVLPFACVTRPLTQFAVSVYLVDGRVAQITHSPIKTFCAFSLSLSLSLDLNRSNKHYKHYE
jgi:hypothetical protein